MESIQRLSEERLRTVAFDWSSRQIGREVQRVFNSRTGQIIVRQAAEHLKIEPNQARDFAQVVAGAFELGWECREAMAQFDELERMMR